MKRAQESLEGLSAGTSEQLAQRVKMGDHLERARPIEHFAYFRSNSAAQSAATELVDEGFRVQVHRKRLTLEVVAITESSIEPDTANRFLCEMFDLVHRHGGIYDGWGGPLVQGES